VRPIRGPCGRGVVVRVYEHGSTRAVYLDAEGQYDLDDDGAKVRGVWLVPGEDGEADQPLIVLCGSGG